MDPPARTAASTPASSPGLFSHPSFIGNQRSPANVTPEPAPQCSPYLHPLQMHRPVKETHKAQVEQDFVTGRKLINQYEIIDEIGRGVHGKVKLARNLETDVFVAIKIIQRFSKKRRLGRVTVSPEDKTKREIAILKKIRHPHVVGLLEVIDDPEYKKIYMVLEYVELGEVVWRKKGVRDICVFERQRQESEARGEDTTNDEKFFVLQGRRRLRKEGLQKAKLSQYEHHEPWSLEYGNTEDEPEEEAFDHMATVNAMPTLSRHNTHESIARSAPRSFRSNQGSRATSRAPSLAASQNSSQVFTPMPPDFQIGPGDDENEDVVPASLPGPLSAASSAAALEGSMYGSYVEEPARPMMRHRTPSMADSIISHMSSIDGFVEHDAFEDDYSYVPCFTIDQARSTFRDTVLGLEYLHYEGIVHRDIKPANLLWTKDHRVKISDFGVSYFGRPIRDGENEEQVSETDAEDFDDDLELAKTVGTPAFFAPELCYTDADIDQPKVNEMIDVWSLGVTLYCLIYARIPFMAEDEFQLFRAIATEPVFIPRRRLRPVDPSYSGSEMNLSKRIGPTTGRYREDAELRMEEIPDDLHDLLSRMLVKDPRRRIKLKDIKLHPWVIQGIDNLPQWIEETDPSRRAQGRRIQVNERELERAVVPLTFLERARSMVKKIGNTIAATTTRSQRGEGSRRRALSSTNSSNGESPHFSGHFSPPAAMREHRRASLRGDEPHLYHAREHHLPSEHPLAQSVTASPEDPAAHLEDPIVQYVLQQQRSPLPTPLRQSSSLTDVESQSPRLDRSGLTATTHTVVHRPSQSLNIPRSEELLEECETVYTPSSADYHGFFTFVNPSRRKSLAGRSSDANLNRSAPQVPEKSLFASNDKHAGASLAISRAVAPGNVEKPVPLRPAKLVLSEVNTPAEIRSPSPHFPPYSATISQPESTLSMALGQDRSHMTSPLTEVRPVTTHGTPEPRTPAPRVWGPSTDESFARAQDQLDRRRQLEIDIQRQQTPPRHTEPKMKDHNIQEEDFAEDVIPPCPVSPDDEIFFHKQQKDRQRKESAISVQSTDIVSPPTTASDMTSPTSSRTLSSSQDQSFASDPSLPALVSGASSVSADADFELLRRSRRGGSPESPVAAHGTPATLTPEMLPKLPEAGGSADDGYPISPGGESFEHEHDDVFGNRREYTSAPVEDYDSDSDEGLTMGRKKPAPTKNFPVRRGTNASVGSNETAKKVPMTE